MKKYYNLCVFRNGSFSSPGRPEYNFYLCYYTTDDINKAIWNWEQNNNPSQLNKDIIFVDNKQWEIGKQIMFSDIEKLEICENYKGVPFYYFDE